METDGNLRSKVSIGQQAYSETSMTIDHVKLGKLVQDIFAAAGCHHHEAERIAHYLVEANLVGHDSHGVIQVPRYIDRVRAGTVVPNQTVEIVSENEIMAVLDGRLGFGQVIGEEAMPSRWTRASRWGSRWSPCAIRATWDGLATGPRWPRGKAR